jgi:hypothetical protein
VSGKALGCEPAAVETAAIALLLVGGFLWGVGWLAGAVLLCLSDAWSLRDKLVGTLVVPGGLALPFLVATRAGLNGGGPLLAFVLVALAAASLASSVHLAHASDGETQRGGSSPPLAR